jgi:hypothetical protein
VLRRIARAGRFRQQHGAKDTTLGAFQVGH